MTSVIVLSVTQYKFSGNFKYPSSGRSRGGGGIALLKPEKSSNKKIHKKTHTMKPIFVLNITELTQNNNSDMVFVAYKKKYFT